MPQHNHAAGSIGQGHRHGVEDVELPDHTHSAGTLSVSSHDHDMDHGHSLSNVARSFTFDNINNVALSSFNSGGSYSIIANMSFSGSPSVSSFSGDTGNRSPGLSGSTGTVSGSPTLGAGQQTSVPTGGGTLSGTTGNAGSGAQFDNRPAYYALAFIIFEGTS